MPITAGGVASGMDTNGIIEKLVEVELEPIKAMQLDLDLNRRKIAALETMSATLKELERASRELYGFRASYDDKNVSSSDPRVINVSTTKLAERGTHKIEVLETASAHVISTDEISEDASIMAGRFTLRIGDEPFNVNFRGGDIKALQERIDEAVSEKISTSIMKTSDGKAVLTLSSKLQGQKGEILLSGDMDILKSIGLAGGMKSSETLGADLKFEKRYFSRYDGDKDAGSQYGELQTGDNGKKLMMTGALWQEYTLPVKIAVKNDTVFEFAALYKQQEENKDESEPLSVEIGPDEKTIVDGIELKGYNISRTPPGQQPAAEQTFDSLLGVGIVSDNGGRRIEKIYPLETEAEAAEQEIPVINQKIPIGKDFAGKQIVKVIFYCNKGEAEFSDARISASDETGNSFEPRNVVAKASDARLIVDGTEVSRDRNTELSDVIKGLNLNINSVSQSPVIIKVEQDIEKSIDKIKIFVESYNRYVDLHLNLTKVDVSKSKTFKPAEFKKRENDYIKNENQNGLFVGDATITRLDNSLRAIISSSYPNRAENQIKVLSQIGVSTGNSNSVWSSIKEGRLVIEEETLREVVSENPEGVRMFFASDTTGSGKEDGGLAFNMVKQLDAYVGSGRNIISTRIGLENDSIKSTNERITRKEDQVRQYQNKLKAKFSTMEKAVSGANAQKTWMNQQMNNANNKQ
ncbi:MAG: flagellar filament capping protein FliD [Leptospirales bacterium]|nr:flagellar filament capping protein FliD [Leptospirales bacterium]